MTGTCHRRAAATSRHAPRRSTSASRRRSTVRPECAIAPRRPIRAASGACRHRRRRRAQFRVRKRRVGLQRNSLGPSRPDDLVFVGLALPRQSGRNISQMPVSWRHPHRMAAAVPLVERRRPRRHAGRSAPTPRNARRTRPHDRCMMRAELVEEPEMRAFGDVVIVHRPEHRPEGKGVDHLPFAALALRA